MAKSEKKEKAGGKAKKPVQKKSSGDDVSIDNGSIRDAVTVPDPPKKTSN